MQLVFVGADHEVTGSCHYIRVGSSNVLIDCGMEQGRDYYENTALPVKPENIDFVFLTHAHIDHTGMIPKLYRDGFRGRILCTHATRDLCDIMLRDSAHIQQQEAQVRNNKAAKRGTQEKYEPVYTLEDAINVMRLIEPYEYDKVHELCEGIRFRFTDVGHLLGSASIELWLSERGEERKIVFSGDIGNKNQPLLRDPKYTEEADYVVMESTYGDRLHEKPRGNHVEQLADIISSTLEKGGNVVIPAFAVGRTQVLLYFIRKIKEQNLVPDFPDFPVYVDSPMAVSATSIFEDNEYDCYDEEASALLKKGINPIAFHGLHLTVTSEESIAINYDETPKVILSASGMCDAGRIKHHLKNNINRPDSTILFVGYQTEGSLGRRILDGAEEIKIFGDSYKVRARVAQMDGLSGHADRNGLLEWIGAFKEKPKQVFVVHGDDEVATAFAEHLDKELDYKAMAPFSGTSYDLIAGEFIRIAKGVRIEKASVERSVSDSYTKLKIALKRLNQVVDAGKGLPNKELEVFTKEINDLCRKYRIDPIK